MPTFIVFLNWTDQGAKNLKDGPKRSDMVKGLIEKNGGKLLGGYIITGQYNVALISDMPSGEAMTKVTIGINAQATPGRPPRAPTRSRSSRSSWAKRSRPCSDRATRSAIRPIRDHGLTSLSESKIHASNGKRRFHSKRSALAAQLAAGRFLDRRDEAL